MTPRNVFIELEDMELEEQNSNAFSSLFLIACTPTLSKMRSHPKEKAHRTPEIPSIRYIHSLIKFQIFRHCGHSDLKAAFQGAMLDLLIMIDTTEYIHIEWMRVNNRPKQRSLRHCIHTGPVSQVHDMRRVRIVPNLFLIQSDEFANVRNWRTKEKESETNFILAEDSV